MNSVAVVVLNWNGMNDTRACVASLTKLSYENYVIVLVDNGSTETNTNEMLNEYEALSGSKLVVLRNASNLGFDGGVNTGIRYALEQDFEYVALINNDAVVDKNWLSELVSASKRKGSSITTGLFLHADGTTIDSTGDWYSSWGLPFPRDRGMPTADASQSGFVFGATGGGTLYSRQLFEDVGLFDEKFFAYYEDTDLSFRAQLAGHTVYYTAAAIAYHKQGASSSKVPGFATYQR